MCVSHTRHPGRRSCGPWTQPISPPTPASSSGSATSPRSPRCTRGRRP